MTDTFFILEATYNPKFPYRLTIKKGGDVLLCLWVQDKWPTEGRRIFCLRQGTKEPLDPLDVVEKIPVISMNQFGKRLTIVLDRATNKRSDFLFLKKRFKNTNNEYEAIFWMSQKAVEEKRPSVRLYTQNISGLDIIIDYREKYPYKFSNCNTIKDRLPVGDYALSIDNKIVAVVERKRFQHLLGQLTNISELNLYLTELKAYKYRAVIIEADYSDFLNPKKLRVFSASFGAKLIAELFAYHPDIPILFVGNRKLGNEWVARFFQSIYALYNQRDSEQVNEVVNKFEQLSLMGGIEYQIRKYIIEEISSEFSRDMIRDRFREIDEKLVDSTIDSLLQKSIIIRIGYNKYVVNQKEEK